LQIKSPSERGFAFHERTGGPGTDLSQSYRNSGTYDDRGPSAAADWWFAPNVFHSSCNDCWLPNFLPPFNSQDKNDFTIIAHTNYLSNKKTFSVSIFPGRKIRVSFNEYRNFPVSVPSFKEEKRDDFSPFKVVQGWKL
jgi:hypothetical protein